MKSSSSVFSGNMRHASPEPDLTRLTKERRDHSVRTLGTKKLSILSQMISGRPQTLAAEEKQT